MRKLKLILTAITAGMLITACGQSSTNTQETSAASTASMPVSTTEASTEAPSKAPDEQSSYEDNFTVDNTAVVEFSDKIKAAVSAQDSEALADLCSFPLYMGFSDEAVSVNSKDEFIALDTERIFTKELLASIEAADNSSLSPSRAGFSLTKDGRPNIIFGVSNGQLAIKGMNY